MTNWRAVGVGFLIVLVVAGAAFGRVGTLFGGGLAIIALFASVLLALDSAIGGAVGGLLG